MEVGLTMGGVGFLLPPPDMISSVMSLPPWFGSRIRIYGIEQRNNSNKSSRYTSSLGVMERRAGRGHNSTTLGAALPGADALQECRNVVCVKTWKRLGAAPFNLET